MAGESPGEIAEALGRTTRWVRKWVARHDEDDRVDGWAESKSRAPHRSPNRTPAELEALILAARARLVANPRAQYESLAIQWELRRVGVVDIPPARTIERILARNEVARPRRRQPGYVS
jgi:transposase